VNVNASASMTGSASATSAEGLGVCFAGRKRWHIGCPGARSAPVG
jgi:hypothetical protein